MRQRTIEAGYFYLAVGTAWALLRRKGHSRQKRTGHPCEQGRDGVQVMLRKWKKKQTSRSGKLAGRNLVYIDECSITTKFARTHGRAKRGKRCEDSIPFDHWNTNTLLVAMSDTGMMAPLLLDGSVDGNVFRYRTENMLIEELIPGQVVICDNAAVHKVAGVPEALAEVGVELLFLPPYSQELNPIEKAFSQIKPYLRKVATRTREDLVEATGKALDLLTPSIACNYIRGCGYSGDQH